MTDTTTCAIIGGGPAGMVLGLLLARAGVEVTVLEKHADFLRDFRGDTVHPSTMRLLDELDLGERFAALPQSKIEQAAIELDGRSVTLVDFRRLNQPHPYVAMVPQWDLLNLLAESAQTEPTFTLRMRTEVSGLLREGNTVTGVRYTGPDGAGELRAHLTVACDGRWSVGRREAGLRPHEYPVPFDVLWFRLPRETNAGYSLVPRTAPGRALIMIPREGYFQIADLIPKGSEAQMRARGIEVLHREVAELAPEVSIDPMQSWTDVKHLDVRLNRLRRWHIEGLLCIGDAAHAMSPVGGVGINLAVQDAVAAARMLATPLRQRRVTGRNLAGVRRRRWLPTAATQTLQRVLHRQIFVPILRGQEVAPPSILVNLIDRLPWLTVVPAYLVGVGIRPERAPEPTRR